MIEQVGPAFPSIRPKEWQGKEKTISVREWEEERERQREKARMGKNSLPFSTPTTAYFFSRFCSLSSLARRNRRARSEEKREGGARGIRLFHLKKALSAAAQ